MEQLLERLERANAALRCRGDAPIVSQRKALDELASLEHSALDALHIARSENDITLCASIISYLSRYWWMRGLTKKGCEEATRTLPLLSTSTTNEETQLSVDAALLGAVQLYYSAADYTSARKCMESLRVLKGRGDALNLEGMIDREQNVLERALDLHRRARIAYAAEKDPWGEAHAISNEAVVLMRMGKIEESLTQHEEALKRRREIKDTLGISSSLGNIALIYNAKKNDPTTARKLYYESLSLREELGDKWGIAGSCVALAAVESNLKSFGESARLLLKAIDAFSSVGDQLGLAECSEAAYIPLLNLGSVEEAIFALGVAEGMRVRINAPSPTVLKHLNELRSNCSDANEFEEIKRKGFASGKDGDIAVIKVRLTKLIEKTSDTSSSSRYLSLGYIAAISIGITFAIMKPSLNIYF